MSSHKCYQITLWRNGLQVTLYERQTLQWCLVSTLSMAKLSGADPGEVKWVNFHPPFSEPPSFFLFLIPQILTSNTSNRLWFYYIITKIHPPFQNPGSAPDSIAYRGPVLWNILISKDKNFSSTSYKNPKRKIRSMDIFTIERVDF